MSSIEKDLGRFKKIIKGRLRKNLKDYIKQGQRVMQKGNKTFAIPLPEIEIPRFKFGSNQNQVGQGEGPGEGKEAGDKEGAKEMEAKFSAEDLAEILGEELELPAVKESAKKNVERQKFKYNTVGPTGPKSLINFKRTYKKALRRQVIEGLIGEDDEDIIVIPDKRDFQYKNFTVENTFENSAVVIYIMDVSGSMGDEQKEVVRNTSFWMNIWLRSQYKSIDTRFIIHDASAKEVDEETFFRTKESGGTVISSAYKLLHKMIYQKYVPEQWNIYVFQFSDGDNWEHQDSLSCLSMLKQDFLPVINLFGYGQVDSPHGSGNYYQLLKDQGVDEKMILAQIKSKSDILNCIKLFLGSGK